MTNSDPADLIERAKDYVDASNAHDVERIEAMLAPDALYLSTGVGRHEGAAAILAMNRSFFGANPDVHWDAQNYRTVADRGVEFDFAISFGETVGNGVERVFFNAAGNIIRVEVER